MPPLLTDETTSRDIWRVTLKNTSGSYTFSFGQSIVNKGVDPKYYDILACITKYNPGTFEYFCSDFGYDTDSRKAEKTYKAVVKEWDNINRIFTDEQIELLREIN